MKAEALLNRRHPVPHTRYAPKKRTIETDPVLAHLLSRLPDMERHGFLEDGKKHVRDYLADKWPDVDAEGVIDSACSK